MTIRERILDRGPGGGDGAGGGVGGGGYLWGGGSGGFELAELIFIIGEFVD